MNAKRVVGSATMLAALLSVAAWSGCGDHAPRTPVPAAGEPSGDASATAGVDDVGDDEQMAMPMVPAPDEHGGAECVADEVAPYIAGSC